MIKIIKEDIDKYIASIITIVENYLDKNKVKYKILSVMTGVNINNKDYIPIYELKIDVDTNSECNNMKEYISGSINNIAHKNLKIIDSIIITHNKILTVAVRSHNSY